MKSLEMYQKLARLIVRRGLNVQNGQPVVRLVKHWNIAKNYRNMASFALEKKIAEEMTYSYMTCTSYMDYLKKALNVIKYDTDIERVNIAIGHIDSALDYEENDMPYLALAEIKKAFPEV